MSPRAQEQRDLAFAQALDVKESIEVFQTMEYENFLAAFMPAFRIVLERTCARMGRLLLRRRVGEAGRGADRVPASILVRAGAESRIGARPQRVVGR